MASIFFSPDYNTLWTAIGAIGQILAAVMAIAALVYSIRTFSKSLTTLHYTELDRMYLDLLKLRLERPYLNPDAKRDPAQQVEYDTYAFMAWNFLETIQDRCERDEHLCETWYPVIDTEEELHREWFATKSENKFKGAFRTFIENEEYRALERRRKKEVGEAAES
ncbi:MAG TPA: hypothetical protein VN256_14750 [Pyrinomonadaceae bacterium]|nr:hypothetical protein [Pyrinomonadaceae bacterium]